MFRSSLDICWIAQPVSAPFHDDLAIFQQLASRTTFSLGLAVVGSAVPEVPSGVPLFPLQLPTLGGLGSIYLSEDDISAFTCLLERLPLALGAEDEGELLVELAHLIMHLGPQFRPNALLRYPSIIRQMVELHQHRGLGPTVTDTILLANELLEIYQKTVAMVNEVPEARLYHAVRGSYAGLIAALAAEKYQARLIYSESLDPEDDLAPFWLQAMPHHWHTSLSNSPVYRQLGERVLMLTRELLYSRAVQFLTPFPRSATSLARQQRTLAPGMAPAVPAARAARESGRISIGWLIPTLTLKMLDKIDEALIHVADLAPHWKITVIEAARHRRGWVCNVDDWLEEHPVTAGCFDAVIPYQRMALATIDLLVALPCLTQPDPDSADPIEVGGEAVCWSILHALQARIPLLSTASVANWFDLESLPGIFVEQPHDGKAIASALREFDQEPALFARYGDSGSEIAERQFSQETAVIELRNLYTSELAKAASGMGYASRRRLSPIHGETRP